MRRVSTHQPGKPALAVKAESPAWSQRKQVMRLRFLDVHQASRDWRADLLFHLRVAAQRGHAHTLASLGELFGVDPRTVRRHLQPLIDDGIVAATLRRGRGAARQFRLANPETPCR